MSDGLSYLSFLLGPATCIFKGAGALGKRGSRAGSYDLPGTGFLCMAITGLSSCSLIVLHQTLLRATF